MRARVRSRRRLHCARHRTGWGFEPAARSSTAAEWSRGDGAERDRLDANGARIGSTAYRARAVGDRDGVGPSRDRRLGAAEPRLVGAKSRVLNRTRRYPCAMSEWRVDEFVTSLTSVSAATRRAYRTDVEAFIEWATRAGAEQPNAVDRRMLRRYLAFLGTVVTRRGAPFARRTIVRRTAALRRYFAWARRAGLTDVDPAARLSAGTAKGRLPRVLGAD